MIGNKIIDEKYPSVGITVSSGYPIEIKSCAVNGRSGVSIFIYPKIKGYTKRFVTKCKCGL